MMYFLVYEGDVVTPGFIEDYLNAENILWRPYGGGEQITFNFAYNLFTLQFMKNYNQLSNERLSVALNEMNIGEFCLFLSSHVRRISCAYFQYS